jgi:hypothetical protein
MLRCFAASHTTVILLLRCFAASHTTVILLLCCFAASHTTVILLLCCWQQASKASLLCEKLAFDFVVSIFLIEGNPHIKICHFKSDFFFFFYLWGRRELRLSHFSLGGRLYSNPCFISPVHLQRLSTPDELTYLY